MDAIEVETYWTNLWFAAADIIELHHAHGNSELFHCELKSNMNIERFPSQSYTVNSLKLQLGAVAYNLMRSIEQIAREFREQRSPRNKEVERRRVGSVIKNFMLGFRNGGIAGMM